MQGDFSVVLYILLSIKEHFALRRDILLPTAVDQRTPAAQEVLKPAVSGSVFGHFWGCGQK